jgi:Flp pilus assembly protein TadB
VLSNAGTRSANLTDTQEITRNTGSLVSRKIWIPKSLYDALPYFYLVAGITALLATLYISNWLWVLPHYLLFSAACLHLGVLVLRRRKRSRSGQEITEPDSG